jgi:hypothetical protein
MSDLIEKAEGLLQYLADSGQYDPDIREISELEKALADAQLEIGRG